MLRSRQDHGFHLRLLNEIYIQSCRPAGEEGNPVLQKTATRELAGCQCDSHPHANQKPEEILGIIDQKVWSPILTKGSRGYKIKVTVDKNKRDLLKRRCMASAKRNPASPTHSSHQNASVRIERGGPADTVQPNFEKAFDKVLYQRLSKKLTCHRMGGKSLTNRKLTNRIQKARFNGQFSVQRIGS